MSMLDIIAELEMKHRCGAEASPKESSAPANLESEEMLDIFKMVNANRKFGINSSRLVQEFRDRFFAMTMDDRLRLAAQTSPCVAEVIKVFGIKNIDITSML